MEYRILNRKDVISVPENSRWKSTISFLRNRRKDNHDKAIIIVLDNLKGFKVLNIKIESRRSGIGTYVSHTLPSHPKPDKSIINRIISTIFVRYVNDMRNIIKEVFYRPIKNLISAAIWLDKFLAPRINYGYFYR